MKTIVALIGGGLLLYGGYLLLKDSKPGAATAGKGGAGSPDSTGTGLAPNAGFVMTGPVNNLGNDQVADNNISQVGFYMSQFNRQFPAQTTIMVPVKHGSASLDDMDVAAAQSVVKLY